MKRHTLSQGMALAAILVIMLIILLLGIALVGMTTSQSRYSVKRSNESILRQAALAGINEIQYHLGLYDSDNWGDLPSIDSDDLTVLNDKIAQIIKDQYNGASKELEIDGKRYFQWEMPASDCAYRVRFIDCDTNSCRVESLGFRKSPDITGKKIIAIFAKRSSNAVIFGTSECHTISVSNTDLRGNVETLQGTGVAKAPLLNLKPSSNGGTNRKVYKTKQLPIGNCSWNELVDTPVDKEPSELKPPLLIEYPAEPAQPAECKDLASIKEGVNYGPFFHNDDCAVFSSGEKITLIGDIFVVGSLEINENIEVRGNIYATKNITIWGAQVSGNGNIQSGNDALGIGIEIRNNSVIHAGIFSPKSIQIHDSTVIGSAVYTSEIVTNIDTTLHIQNAEVQAMIIGNNILVESSRTYGQIVPVGSMASLTVKGGASLHPPSESGSSNVIPIICFEE